MSAPIESKRADAYSSAAPTPQNTPANAAHIAFNKPNPMPSIGEVHEPTAMGKGDVQKLIETLNKSQHSLSDLSKYPSSVRDRIYGLKSIQKEHRRLEGEFQQEILRLEKEYFNKYSPLYKKRQQVVTGAAEPTADEIRAGREDEEAEADEPKDDTDKTDAAVDVKGIPLFWLTVLKNREQFATIITDRDEPALEKLVDIRLEYLDTPGFRIIFDFGAPENNEFFSNQILTKTYYYQKDLGYSGSFIYDHAEGDKIQWKDGKDLTTKVEKRTQRNKTTRQTRTVSRTVTVDSFFHFFTVPTAESEDQNGAFDADILEAELEEDYQRGEDLKEKLIPHALDWFTGEAHIYESSDGVGYDDDDFLSDNDDDAEDDSEYDEEDDNGKPKAEAAECKQS